jgi:hypothetical protein
MSEEEECGGVIAEKNTDDIGGYRGIYGFFFAECAAKHRKIRMELQSTTATALSRFASDKCHKI